ncbi:MAG: GDP-L-fucose synthase [Deltaproteobacteria bacterium]|nr:GDP-L-fucose synthase [Deltaproteobacteria bacterium]
MATEISKEARIYVAGHGGLVGSAVLRRLRQEGFSNILTATREQLDLRDQAAVNYWFRANRPEFVFLVAGTVGGILANATRPAEFIYDNMMIHATVVHAAYIFKVNKLLYLGSSCIYPRECPQPIKEEYLLTDVLEPTNEAYAIAKIAGIKLCQAYHRQYGCNFISGMPTNLYGPHDNFDLQSSHVLPALIRKFHLAKLAAQGKWEEIEADEKIFGPLPEDLRLSLGLSNRIRPLAGGTPQSVIIWGSGAPRREFLYVDDLADACLFIMRHYEPYLEPGPIVQRNVIDHLNIGTGVDQTIRELAEAVQKIVYPEANLIFDHTKPDGTPQKLLDICKLKDLQWRPRIGLEEGIAQTYDWYVKETERLRGQGG